MKLVDAVKKHGLHVVGNGGKILAGDPTQPDHFFVCQLNIEEILEKWTPIYNGIDEEKAVEALLK